MFVDARLAQAVTDAELEVLEKQIQQQEAEMKRNEQEAAAQKRESEEKAKAREVERQKTEEARQAELEKIRQEERQKILEEQRKQAEQARLEEERLRQQEANRIADEERIRQEVERRLAEEEAEKKRQAIEAINKVCGRIVGTWKWNDLAGSITRFFEDGKVVTTNLLQSSGEWECIDARNRVFTFNTWNTLRKIYMDENFQELKSTGLLGESLTAVRLSDDPAHKSTPGKNDIQDLLGQ